jgi:hypothetical protein
MRHPIFLLATIALVSPLVSVLATPATAQPKPTTVAACPYLNNSKDENTSSTNAMYDPATKILQIRVTRSVPDAFWPVAESMTRERANKILEQCTAINQVHVTFQSGQKMIVARNLNAKH